MNAPQKPIILAVVDSGVDTAHPDLSDNIWQDQDGKKGIYVIDPTQDGQPSAMDSSGREHGTHVAGLAAAISNNNTGVAGVLGQNVKIMPINVVRSVNGSSTTTDTASVIKGIRYAIENNADVINLSLGGSQKDPALRRAIEEAIANGSLVVAAAGNGSPGEEITETRPQVPAIYGAEICGLITVCSSTLPNVLNTENPLFFNDITLSLFSHYSSKFVEICAPGSDLHFSGTGEQRGLYSTVLSHNFLRLHNESVQDEAGDAKPEYSDLRGTSMSTPLVSGAALAALSYARSKGLRLTPQDLEYLIQKSARQVRRLKGYVQGGRKGGYHLDLSGLIQGIENIH